MRLWRYVIVSDNGTAPNYLSPALTLALRKPRIRFNAIEGDAVLAFAGRDLCREKGCDPEAVVWAGVVTNRLSFSEYWNDPRFAAKKVRPDGDNIYEPHPAEPSGHRQHPHAYHGPTSASTDLAGKNVLIFGGPDAWAFHHAPPTLPGDFDLSMGAGRRNHKVGPILPHDWARLRSWLSSQQARDSPHAFHVMPLSVSSGRSVRRTASVC